MPRLNKHKRSGAIGMFKAGVVFLPSPDIITAIRQLYSTSDIVTRLPGQLKIDTGLVN